MVAACLQMYKCESKASLVYTVNLEVILAVYRKGVSQFLRGRKKKYDLNLN